MSLHIGRFNTLTVMRLTRPGAFLSDGSEEVLLPYRHVPPGLKVGDSLEVFVYCDSEDRTVATTQKPLAQVGQFAAMTVKNVTSFGAFLDWGLDKDLLLPFAEQGRRPREGQKVPVFVYYDDISHRIAASTKLNRYTVRHPDRIHVGSQVDILPYSGNDAGWRCVVNRKFEGILYRDKLYEQIRSGDERRAWVTGIRDDGIVEVSLRELGYSAVANTQVPKVLEIIRRAGGYMPYNADSEPEMIREVFQMSKRDFKKAIGALYKDRVIIIEEHGVRLVPEKKK